MDAGKENDTGMGLDVSDNAVSAAGDGLEGWCGRERNRHRRDDAQGKMQDGNGELEQIRVTWRTVEHC